MVFTDFTKNTVFSRFFMETMKLRDFPKSSACYGKSGDDICEHLRDKRLQFGTQRTQTLSTALQIVLICSEISLNTTGKLFSQLQNMVESYDYMKMSKKLKIHGKAGFYDFHGFSKFFVILAKSTPKSAEK